MSNKPSLTRKIVQIFVVPADEKYFRTVYVVADDGTAWAAVASDQFPEVWTRLPNLPPREEQP